jgi:hypothetical protein
LRILIHRGSKADLSQVTGALHTQGGGANFVYGGKEQGGKNGENAENYD